MNDIRRFTDDPDPGLTRREIADTHAHQAPDEAPRVFSAYTDDSDAHFAELRREANQQTEHEERMDQLAHDFLDFAIIEGCHKAAQRIRETLNGETPAFIQSLMTMSVHPEISHIRKNLVAAVLNKLPEPSTPPSAQA